VERSPEEAQPEVRAADDVSKQVVRESASVGYFAQQGDLMGRNAPDQALIATVQLTRLTQ